MPKTITPIISIIIPCLNEEKYLPLLLDDIRLQNFSDYEVLVVDGNSTDSTAGIVRDLGKQDERFHLVNSSRGVSIQRNAGARKARGNYFVFLDADCRIGSVFLFDLYRAFGRSGLDLAFIWAVPDVPTLLQRLHIFVCNMCMSISVRTHMFVFGWAEIIITPAVFSLLGGYDPTISYAEDAEFIRRAVRKKFSVGYITNPHFTMSLRRIRKMGFIRYYRKVLFNASPFWLQNKNITQKDSVYDVVQDRKFDI